MERQSFTAEFKYEAVRLVRERGITVNQAARDLGLHENVLHKWVRSAKRSGTRAFLGRGKQRPDDAETSRLKRELAKTQAERGILKKPLPTSRRNLDKICPNRETPKDLAGVADVRDARCLASRVSRVAFQAAERSIPA